MAEIVAEMQERLLAEYEQLKKFEICTNEQLRECIRKRQSLQTKVTQSEKSIRDYADFIIFEKKVHKWVKEKERIHGTALKGLKSSIVTRIMRLYRDGLRQFPHEERFWNNYVQFSKKSMAHEVTGIYEKMLTFHGNNPGVWCDAALWAYEYSLNMPRVKEIFFRGLQRHPQSEAINRTFFDILLMEASKMSAEKNLENNTTSEQEIGLERVEVVYRNSKKEIFNISYYLSLLERCEEEKFKNLTAPLQKAILDDLMQLFSRDETLWDALAQRELRGFNMADLQNVHSKDSVETEHPSDQIISTTATDGAADSEEASDVKDASLTGVWQRRTLSRRIELCCKTYQTAVRVLQTPKMWSLYITAMLKLNQDMTTQKELKRKRLAIAFKEGHESRMLSVDHYCTFVRMLLESSNGVQLAETILSEAVKVHKSARLYQTWLSTYIVDNNEPRVEQVFRQAIDALGPAESFPLWRTVLLFYKTRTDACAEKLLGLYKEACRQMSTEFGVFRAEYLEYCMLHADIEKTRAEYDELCQLPPPCLALHQKMAELESRLAVQTKSDEERWRLCLERAVLFFGKTDTSVWLDYIRYERDHGDVKRMSLLYQRAKDTLNDNLVENFISEYTLLMGMV